MPVIKRRSLGQVGIIQSLIGEHELIVLLLICHQGEDKSMLHIHFGVEVT